jgi:hypothetical protein
MHRDGVLMHQCVSKLDGNEQERTEHGRSTFYRRIVHRNAEWCEGGGAGGCAAFQVDPPEWPYRDEGLDR